MFQKALTWILLINLLNTLLFFEVPATLRPSEQVSVSVSGGESFIDSLVEFVLGYCLDQPDLLAEEDFDDTPDHLKRNKLQEFFLQSLPSRLAVFSASFTQSHPAFKESISSLAIDVLSPPPQA